jgi:hypothetical protein
MKSLRRVATALWREWIARSTPHGLVNIAYLRPRPGPAVELHRSLWLDGLPGWPRPLVLFIEATLWLRWTLFGAWRATWRAVRRRGAAASAGDGVSIARQTRRVLGLALRWGVPPGQAYLFGLHVPPGRDRRGADDPALDYIFAAEGAAWHRHMNRCDPGRQPAIALLQDKTALARRLAPAGVAVVETWATWTPGDTPDLRAWLDSHVPAKASDWPGLFFKLRDGMGGLGAFAAWRREGVWEARAIDGRAVQGLPAIQPLWEALIAQGAVLVQPRLTTQPQLAALACNDDAVTVRVITRHEPERTRVLLAIVEAPLGHDGLHASWAVDAVDGAVRSRTWAGHAANRGGATGSPAAPEPEQGLCLPAWDRLQAQSCAAHDIVGALGMIAWDWVPTPGGWRLLEGNSSWSLGAVQRLFGPVTTLGTSPLDKWGLR